MRNTILLLLLLFAMLKTFSQIANKPSYYEFPPLTNEIKDFINSIPHWEPESIVKKNGVSFIDNSTNQYFPPVFDQKGNSCSQASGIRYAFTYEINALRGIASTGKNNIYSYHYTYNFLNNGNSDNGTWYFDGFNLASINGLPTLSDFDDDNYNTSARTWMNGYSKYFNAMHNRIKSYSKIKADASDGLEKIKSYLVDHGNGSEVGGVLIFSGKSSNWVSGQYTGPSNTNVNYIVKNFGNGGDHAMTIVGFDDAIECDIDSDGTIEEDEVGALIVVNSWGSYWGDNGKYYMPYKLLKLSEWNGGIGNGDKYVYLIQVEDHTPQIVFKVKIEHSSRNDLKFKLGVADDPNAETPKYIQYTKTFNNQGGDFYMQGGSYSSHKTIEVGFNISDLLPFFTDTEQPKYFLTVYQNAVESAGSGIIKSFSVLDYRNAATSPKEYICSNKNVPIESKTVLSVAQLPNNLFEPENTVSNNIDVYPNPVKGNTTIEFTMPQKDNVIVYLTDQVGRKISLIYSGKLHQGRQSINWFPDHTISPGIYFVHLNLSNSSIVKKIVCK